MTHILNTPIYYVCFECQMYGLIHFLDSPLKPASQELAQIASASLKGLKQQLQQEHQKLQMQRHIQQQTQEEQAVNGEYVKLPKVKYMNVLIVERVRVYIISLLIRQIMTRTMIRTTIIRRM